MEVYKRHYFELARWSLYPRPSFINMYFGGKWKYTVDSFALYEYSREKDLLYIFWHGCHFTFVYSSLYVIVSHN